MRQELSKEEILKSSIEQAIAYILKKNRKLKRSAVREILYTADIYHMVQYGRSITGGEVNGVYELNSAIVNKIIDRKFHIIKMENFDYLSNSDIDVLDTAILRYEAEITPLPKNISLKINSKL